MIASAELSRDTGMEVIAFRSSRFVALQNAAEDLRCMASINESLMDRALDGERCRRDENGMLLLRFSDEWVRDLVFAAYHLRRRAQALADDMDRISSEAFDAPS